MKIKILNLFIYFYHYNWRCIVPTEQKVIDWVKLSINTFLEFYNLSVVSCMVFHLHYVFFQI